MIPQEAPKGAIVLLHFLFVFSVLAFACSEPWSVGILQILIAAFACVVVWGIGVDPVRLPQAPLLAAVIGLLLMGAAQLYGHASAGSPCPGFGDTCSPWATRNALALWSSYGMLMLCASAVLQSPRQAKRMAWSIFMLGALTAIGGVVLRSQSPTLLLGFRHIEAKTAVPFGPFVNRDHAASFLAMTGMMGWGLLLLLVHDVTADDSRSSHSDRLAQAGLVLSLNLAIAFCVYSTGSRAGFHALLVGTIATALLAVLLFGRGFQRILSLTGVAAGICAYGYSLYAIPNWRGYINGQWIGSLRWRVSILNGSIHLLRDCWPTGIGLGAFQFAFPPYQSPIVNGLVTHAHNDWLEIAIEEGAPMFLLFVGCGFAFFWTAVRKWSAASSAEARGILGGALGGLLAVCFHMLLDFPCRMPADAVTVILLASVFSRANQGGATEGVRALRSPLWLRLGVTAMAASVVSLSVPRIAADCYALRAAEAQPTTKVYYLSNALHWDENPLYAVRLGLAYMTLAQETPPAHDVLLRQGMAAILPFCLAYPNDPGLARLQQDMRTALRSTST